jgi:hypothetical protein
MLAMKILKIAFAAAFALLMFAASPLTASAAEWGYWHPVPVAAPVVPVERPAFQPVYYSYGYAYHHGSACRNWWFRVHHRRICG